MITLAAITHLKALATAVLRAEAVIAAAREWRAIDAEIEKYMAGCAPTSTWNQEREAYEKLRAALDALDGAP